MVAAFRERNVDTPLILMGYFNPIYSYGVEPFLRDAKAAGVDGLIVVDLPPEEDDELCLPAMRAGLAFIRLATPTTTTPACRPCSRTPRASSITSPSPASPAQRRPTPRRRQGRRPDKAAHRPAGRGRLWRQGRGERRRDRLAADGVVVGSALVEAIRTSLDEGKATAAPSARSAGWWRRSPAPGVRGDRPAA